MNSQITLNDIIDYIAEPSVRNEAKDTVQRIAKNHKFTKLMVPLNINEVDILNTHYSSKYIDWSLYSDAQLKEKKSPLYKLHQAINSRCYQ